MRISDWSSDVCSSDLIVEVTPDMFTVVTLVASGFGVAVLPASICCISLPGVVYRPLADDLQHAELAFAFRKNDSAPAVRALIGEVRSLWRSSDLTDRKSTRLNSSH